MQTTDNAEADMGVLVTWQFAYWWGIDLFFCTRGKYKG